MKRLIPAIVGVLALATLAVPTAFVTAFAASNSGTVKAVTHASHHPDTCVCASPVSSSNGTVWAYDNLSRQFKVTDNGGGNYTVVITDHGSFAAFAEPNNPVGLNTFWPITANGSIDGTITYTVQASQGPDASLLPAQVPGDTSTTATVQLLFNSSVTSFGGGDYTYTYRAGGETYTQTTSGITGDITGH